MNLLPEILLHLLIPAAALIIIGFDRKLVLYFCPLAVFHDLDILFGAHRAIFHSIFVLGPIALILLFYTFNYKPEWKSHAIIISVFLLSQPFMDLFTGPIQLLWPLDTHFYLWIQAPTIDPSTLTINFGDFFIKFLILTPQQAGALPGAGDPIHLFYNQGLIALILIGLAMLFWLLKSRKSETQQKNSTILPAEDKS